MRHAAAPVLDQVYGAIADPTRRAILTLLAAGGEGPGEQSGEVLVVRRVLPVERERVFAAWLDPVSLATWMRPGETTDAIVEVDPRVGGRFRILMQQPQASCSYEHQGEYLAIE